MALLAAMAIEARSWRDEMGDGAGTKRPADALGRTPALLESLSEPGG